MHREKPPRSEMVNKTRPSQQRRTAASGILAARHPVAGNYRENWAGHVCRGRDRLTITFQLITHYKQPPAKTPTKYVIINLIRTLRWTLDTNSDPIRVALGVFVYVLWRGKSLQHRVVRAAQSRHPESVACGSRDVRPGTRNIGRAAHAPATAAAAGHGGVTQASHQHYTTQQPYTTTPYFRFW